jgi:hypothetical protein
MSVEYRSIPGFPGYRIGSDGTVWSNKKLGRKRGVVAWRKMSPATHKSGHKIASLSKKNRIYSFYVHRLVLEAFVGPCPPGKVARHFPDQNPANNAINNLQWGEWSDNNGQDKVLNNTSNRGSRCGASKLTSRDVKSIREAKAKGESTTSIALDHRVSLATVCDIVSRRTWGWLE